MARAFSGGPLPTRRQVLGLALAAVAFSMDRSSLERVGLAAPKAALPKLASSATVAHGQVQRFRSRPDLAPAAVQINIDEPGQDSGLIFMDSHTGPGDQGPLIIDGSGGLVWFEQVSATRTSAARAFNLRVQQWRGEPVLTWFDGSVVAAHGEGEYVIMDRSYTVITRVRAGNGYSDDLHAFSLTPGGNALITSYGLAHADLTPYGGKANAPYFYGVAQEIDIASGKVVFQWRSDEHVGLGESYAPISHYGTRPWDYFHINAVGLAPDGDLIVSGRNTWGVYKVERASGKVLWRLGGKKSDFKLGPGAHFAWQHDVSEHANGSFTVFDNGAGVYKSEPQSRGLVLRVDEANRQVTLERQYLHPRVPLLAGALGSVQLLPQGHAFIGWGAEAAFTEFAANGTPLLDGRLVGKGVQSYRAFRQVWTGFPTEPPAIAVDRNATAMTVYVSWNGATQVSDWLVLGGQHPSALTAIGTAAKKGFETVVQVPRRTAYVAVAGLDGRGKKLGQSKVVAT